MASAEGEQERCVSCGSSDKVTDVLHVCFACLERLSPERYGALKRVYDIREWATGAARLLARPDILDTDVIRTVRHVNEWWAQTVAGLKRKDPKDEAAYEIVVLVHEAIQERRTPEWVVQWARTRWPEHAGNLDRGLLEKCLNGKEGPRRRIAWEPLHELLVAASLRVRGTGPEALRTGLYAWYEERGATGSAIRSLFRGGEEP